jgi:predicted nucleic acid-binding protein
VELVDTVYLVAFLNPDDPRHEEAALRPKQLRKK